MTRLNYLIFWTKSGLLAQYVNWGEKIESGFSTVLQEKISLHYKLVKNNFLYLQDEIILWKYVLIIQSKWIEYEWITLGQYRIVH